MVHRSELKQAGNPARSKVRISIDEAAKPELQLLRWTFGPLILAHSRWSYLVFTPTSTSRFRRWCIIFFGLFLLFACSSLSADPFAARLDGKVLDPQGSPVPTVHVSLVNAA